MQKTKLKKLLNNEYYAKMLKTLFASGDSETSSFMQFLYYSYVLSPYDDEFSKALYDIAQEDLDHHAILAECILMLGGDPVYANGNGLWFSGRNVDYVKSTKQILSLGIEIKEKQIINYKTVISKISEKEILSVLEMILSDEQKHKEILENLLKKYSGNASIK